MPSRRTWVAAPGDEGLRLDAFLGRCLPDIGLRGRRRLCGNGLILVQGRTAGPALKMRPGMTVVLADDDGPAFAAPPIAGRSDGLAAVAKPAGMPCATVVGGDAALEAGLAAIFPECRPPLPRLLNRLDTGTSGLVMIATDADGERRWKAAEAAASVRKEYLAVVEGAVPCGARRVLDAALDTDDRRTTRVLPGVVAAPERRTLVESLGPFDTGSVPCSLVVCTIAKGARHQIRAHLAHAGHALLGDPRYGAATAEGFRLHHVRCTIGGFSPVTPPPWLDALPDDLRAAVRRRFPA